MEASGSWRDRERTVWYYMRGRPPVGFVPINRQHVISECTTKNERIIQGLGFRIISQCDLNTVMLREINKNRDWAERGCGGLKIEGGFKHLGLEI